MTCHCPCHIQGWSGYMASGKPCLVCADFHVVPETETTNELVHGNYMLTPQALASFKSTVTAHQELYIDAMRYEFDLWVGHVRYTASLQVSLGLLPHLTDAQLKHELCKKMAGHFNKNGWPTAVVAALKSPAASEHWGQHWAQQPAGYVDGRRVVSDLRRAIPGLGVVQRCPHLESLYEVEDVNGEMVTRQIGTSQCARQFPLEGLIQHVNDGHRWTRAQIADWLESLDIDLSFPDEVPEPLPEADPHKMLLILAPNYGAAASEAQRRRRRMGAWRHVSTNRMGAELAFELRGRRREQYTVVGGLTVSEHLQRELAYIEAYEVGEEADQPAPDLEVKVETFKSSPHLEHWHVDTTKPQSSAYIYELAQKIAKLGPLAKIPEDLLPMFEKKEDTAPTKKPGPLELKAQQAAHQQHLKHDPTKSRRTKKS